LRHGVVPCAPYSPTVAVSVRVLELFRNCSLRCPHLAIQPFVKGLCDVHGVPFRPYLSTQFSICLDLYLSIRDEVDRRLQEALGQDSPNWRLRHACPACTHKLDGEAPLTFDILITMDGNDSLKRIQKRARVAEDLVEGEEASVGESNERIDTRCVSGDYYLSRQTVDRWSKEVLEKLACEPTVSDISLSCPTLLTMLQTTSPDNYSVCEDRWKNMSNELTERMWGIFDETGVFLCLCRHGFVLLLADMVHSGELSVIGLIYHPIR